MTISHVVVGGGIAGLAAAHTLITQHHAEPGDVMVLDAAARVGGLLGPVDLAGRIVDAGADAVLTRRPEGVALLELLDLREEMVRPATSAASIAWAGQLHPFPPGTVLGVPTTAAAIERATVLSDEGRDRAREGLAAGTQGEGEDVTVSELVSRRWGLELTERLAGPLIAAVHAGRADYLSAEMCAAPLFPSGAPAAPSSAPPPGTSPFVSLTGGLWQMADALRRRLEEAGVAVRTAARVESLQRSANAWTIQTADSNMAAERLVIALPSNAAAELLGPIAPRAAEGLSSIERASVAIAVVLLQPNTQLPEGSGFLVPAGASDGLLTACTFFDQKWPHTARSDGRVVRLSAGRHGDGRFEDLDDTELVGRLVDELGSWIGSACEPVAASVTRYHRAFPQYAVGHRGLAHQIRRELESSTRGTVVACGNSFDGVGLPAVIASARAAAAAVSGAP